MGYLRNGRNLLPVDPASGGQAAMTGWYDFTGTVHPDAGDATVTLAPQTGISTSPITEDIAPFPIPVQAGVDYTAAATVTGLTLICVQWIAEDGEAGDRVYSWGWSGKRAVVTATAPQGATGAVVNLFVPVVLLVGDPDENGVQAVTYYAPAAWPDAPGAILADYPSVPVTVSGVVFLASTTDPGPLPPVPEDLSLGTQWYQQLPAVYRVMDTDGVLRRFLQGYADPADRVGILGEAIARGRLTDPVLADDLWVSWLAQALGVPVTPSFTRTRELLLSRGQSPAIGTPPAISALVKTWLTGTRTVDVLPGSAPWTITVRVRTDELGLVGDDPAQLAAALRGTGLFPAGWAVEVDTTSQTWDDIDAAVTVWDDADTGHPTWAVTDSIGL